MLRATPEEFKGNLSRYLDQVEQEGERVIVEEAERTRAVLVSVAEYEFLRELEDRMDLAAARAALAEAGEDIDWEVFKKTLGL